jgi:hypothetical protein
MSKQTVVYLFWYVGILSGKAFMLSTKGISYKPDTLNIFAAFFLIINRELSSYKKFMRDQVLINSVFSTARLLMFEAPHCLHKIQVSLLLLKYYLI